MKARVLILISASLLIAAGILNLAVAAPQNPWDHQNVTTQTMLNTSYYSVIKVGAGNVTQVNFSQKIPTQTWAGIYGNVSGTVSLEDSTGSIFYKWALDQPAGEIYAANNTHPNFDAIIAAAGDWHGFEPGCWPTNISGNDASGYFGAGAQLWGNADFFGLHEIEEGLGLNKNFEPGLKEDPDGINETFTIGTNYPSFYVGTRQFTGDVCTEVTTYVGNTTAAGTRYFHEVLLYDNISHVVVWAAIINNSAPTGWDGGRYHFQMLLGDNGHAPDTATTEYYFFVELE